MASANTPAISGTGEKILEIARLHIGEKYVFGVSVPKNHTDWRGPWDCAEFLSWLVFQVSGILYGCDNDFGDPASADAFTGYWERDVNSSGIRVSVEQAARTLGAAILRVPRAKSTGHIVVSDGKGGTVEAHSSRVGVIASQVGGRRWDMGILVPGIAYSEGSTVAVAPPDTTIYRLMSPMTKGAKVLEVQQSLKAAGYSPGALDGIFGRNTQAAVIAFQLAEGLVPDGEVGPQTAKALGIQLESV